MENIAEITIENIAKMIDHSILHPAFTDSDLKNNCKIAIEYNVATVCVKPYHTKPAASLLKNTDVSVCSVIGFPHGNSATEIKITEALQVIKDGAVEVDMVVNIGKVLQADWKYVDNEINCVNNICRKNGAIVKVIFETDYITHDDYKEKLCEICSNRQAAFVKTSTGFGFVKGSDGKYSYTGANEHDVALMRRCCSHDVKIKASGGIRTLDQLLKMRELGAARIGATATVDIMEEARKRFS